MAQWNSAYDLPQPCLQPDNATMGWTIRAVCGVALDWPNRATSQASNIARQWSSAIHTGWPSTQRVILLAALVKRPIDAYWQIGSGRLSDARSITVGFLGVLFPLSGVESRFLKSKSGTPFPDSYRDTKGGNAWRLQSPSWQPSVRHRPSPLTMNVRLTVQTVSVWDQRLG